MSICRPSCVGEVEVTFDVTELANGLYTTTLHVSSHDPSEPQVDASKVPINQQALTSNQKALPPGMEPCGRQTFCRNERERLVVIGISLDQAHQPNVASVRYNIEVTLSGQLLHYQSRPAITSSTKSSVAGMSTR
jgi:hypothetical protein